MIKLYFLLILLINLLWSACTSTPREEADSAVPQRDSTPQQAAPAEVPLEKGYEAAYQYRTNIPDPLMKKIPQSIETYRSSNPEEYIRQLAAYIVKNSAGDFDKVKKAHDWVSLSIRYNSPAFFANQIPSQSIAHVVTSRLAVCEGYSKVFKALCDAMEISCVIIQGYGRGIGSAPFMNENPEDSNHAWNKVKINGDWYLVDTTWDAGYLNGRNYEAFYTTDYLFLKPEHFIFRHFPINPEDQLLDNPISASVYPSLPLLRPRFFDTITSISPDLQRKNRVDRTWVLSFLPKEDVQISVLVYDEKGGTEYNNVTFVQKEGEVYKAYLAFPNSGNYEVRLYSQKQGEKTAAVCGEFGVTATAGSNIRYPIQYGDFTAETTLMSPLEMPLQKNKTYQFRIKSNKKYVALIIDNRFFHLTQDAKGIFSLDTVIPAHVTEISVVAGDMQYGNYQAILKYAVW